MSTKFYAELNAAMRTNESPELWDDVEPNELSLYGWTDDEIAQLETTIGDRSVAELLEHFDDEASSLEPIVCNALQILIGTFEITHRHYNGCWFRGL